MARSREPTEPTEPAELPVAPPAPETPAMNISDAVNLVRQYAFQLRAFQRLEEVLTLVSQAATLVPQYEQQKRRVEQETERLIASYEAWVRQINEEQAAVNGKWKEELADHQAMREMWKKEAAEQDAMIAKQKEDATAEFESMRQALAKARHDFEAESATLSSEMQKLYELKAEEEGRLKALRDEIEALKLKVRGV